ncbi:hypothetical protein DV735_g5179, partial [Chaetothyriales sp. CBS 134920]
MPNFQEIIKLIEGKKKRSFPWERTTGTSVKRTPPTAPLKRFRVLAWNIDFMLPYPNERMQVALDHVIIFFNEMLVSDLRLIQAQPWIQQGYNITDIDSRFWESGHYGTCTLVPKSLPIAAVFRVHYAATNMERDALFVDVDVGNGRLLTFANSHLESLVATPPLRPEQVRTAARNNSGGQVVIGGVMGGDFNAIQPFDRSLHADNGLKDAFLELGGSEDTDEGYTWGQMAPIKQREMFGCSRMDKFFFAGDIEVVDFHRFGNGVEVKHQGIRKALVEEEGMDGGWVTDHLGIMATFKLPSSIATTRL